MPLVRYNAVFCFLPKNRERKTKRKKKKRKIKQRTEGNKRQKENMPLKCLKLNVHNDRYSQMILHVHVFEIFVKAAFCCKLNCARL